MEKNTCPRGHDYIRQNTPRPISLTCQWPTSERLQLKKPDVRPYMLSAHIFFCTASAISSGMGEEVVLGPVYTVAIVHGGRAPAIAEQL